ncbi:MAG: glycerate kinase [Planctomycetota bacterium]|jgi:glycerate kinase
MKIVIAMDSFKGSLSAEQACEAVAEGLLSALPDLEIVATPVADGGEGTARAMIAASDGRWVSKEVMGPLPDMKANGGYAWFDGDRTALVEMASVSGLELLGPAQRNPLKTTSYGTGELIRAAAEQRPQRILLAVGGSATVDGGVGAAMALGWRFLDDKDDTIPLGGGELHRIRQIIPPKDLNLPAVEVLCDVENRLCGPEGAARIFAPQKGATPEMVDHLERDLRHLAQAVAGQLRKDIDVARAGAAGGLAAGALAFMNAKLSCGIDVIIECTGLEDRIAASDWVVTGEGRFDEQSLYGKAVSGIVKIAAKKRVPVAVLAGSISLTEKEYLRFGVVDAIGAQKNGISLKYAITHAGELLAEAAAEFAEKHLICRS